MNHLIHRTPQRLWFIVVIILIIIITVHDREKKNFKNRKLINPFAIIYNNIVQKYRQIIVIQLYHSSGGMLYFQ